MHVVFGLTIEEWVGVVAIISAFLSGLVFVIRLGYKPFGKSMNDLKLSINELVRDNRERDRRWQSDHEKITIHDEKIKNLEREVFDDEK